MRAVGVKSRFDPRTLRTYNFEDDNLNNLP
jgi:hypothetical protein